ncbi:MAG: hypothetical protein V4726_00850 [Verrucomicrobiota bacterium]
MPITFGGSTLADNDEDGFDGAFDISGGGRPVMQVDAVIDSVAPSTKHRGNISFSFTFSSRRRHASPAAAKTFIGTHATAVASSPGPFAGFGVSLDTASCTVDTRVIGITTISTYSITGSHNPGA